MTESRALHAATSTLSAQQHRNPDKTRVMQHVENQVVSNNTDSSYELRRTQGFYRLSRSTAYVRSTSMVPSSILMYELLRKNPVSLQSHAFTPRIRYPFAAIVHVYNPGLPVRYSICTCIFVCLLNQKFSVFQSFEGSTSWMVNLLSSCGMSLCISARDIY